jgi:hypothetical protein
MTAQRFYICATYIKHPLFDTWLYVVNQRFMQMYGLPELCIKDAIF